MKTTTLYPIAERERLHSEDWKRLNRDGLSFTEREKIHGFFHSRIRAVLTGEKRAPRRGEWYLSGAIVEAYRAPNDLSTPFHICRLVLTETKTITTVVEVA